jgi:hypothetical protein
MRKYPGLRSTTRGKERWMMKSLHDGKEYPNVETHDWKVRLVSMKCERCKFLWKPTMSAREIPACKPKGK